MKHYVSVADLKRFLYIDFEENDEVLGDMIFAAEGIIEKRIRRKLCELENEEELLPYPILQAIKIMAGNLYANRESVSFNATPMKIPYSFEYLISPYIQYKKENKCKHHQKHHWEEMNSEENNDTEVDNTEETNNSDYGCF